MTDAHLTTLTHLLQPQGDALDAERAELLSMLQSGGDAALEEVLARLPELDAPDPAREDSLLTLEEYEARCMDLGAAFQTDIQGLLHLGLSSDELTDRMDARQAEFEAQLAALSQRFA